LRPAASFAQQPLDGGSTINHRQQDPAAAGGIHRAPAARVDF